MWKVNEMRVISPIANGKGPTHHWVELSDAAAAWSCIIATAVQTATVGSATHNTLAIVYLFCKTTRLWKGYGPAHWMLFEVESIPINLLWFQTIKGCKLPQTTSINLHQPWPLALRPPPSTTPGFPNSVSSWEPANTPATSLRAIWPEVSGVTCDGCLCIYIKNASRIQTADKSQNLPMEFTNCFLRFLIQTEHIPWNDETKGNAANLPKPQDCSLLLQHQGVSTCAKNTTPATLSLRTFSHRCRI